MQVNINTIQTTTNIPECISIHELQKATLEDNHLQQLKEQVIRGRPEYRDHIT